MLGFTPIARLFQRTAYTQVFSRPLLSPTYVRSTIHTGGPSSLSPSNSHNATAFPDLGRHFWTIDSNNKDREYLNARCTTIKPPASQPSNSSTSTSSGELSVEHVQKVSKVKLCHENGIQPRDLRSLDTDMVPLLPLCSNPLLIR
jgi:hypothetical protein